MERIFLEMFKLYSGDPHQIQHFTKVHNYARLIGLCEGLDHERLEILEIAAIVHDIGIKAAVEKHGSSGGKYQELEGPPVAEEMLSGLGYAQHVIDRVCYLVGHHHTYQNIDGIDCQILIEADFLVNMFEDNMTEERIRAVLEKIFRTETGKRYCQLMFNISP